MFSWGMEEKKFLTEFAKFENWEILIMLSCWICSKKPKSYGEEKSLN